LFRPWAPGLTDFYNFHNVAQTVKQTQTNRLEKQSGDPIGYGLYESVVNEHVHVWSMFMFGSDNTDYRILEGNQGSCGPGLCLTAGRQPPHSVCGTLLPVTGNRLYTRSHFPLFLARPVPAHSSLLSD